MAEPKPGGPRHDERMALLTKKIDDWHDRGLFDEDFDADSLADTLLDVLDEAGHKFVGGDGPRSDVDMGAK